MTGLLYTAEVCFVFICVFLILLILIQKGRGGGLSSAFGGAGGQTAFGSKTGDVLTWATSVVFGLFLFLAVVLNLIANHVDAAHYGTPTTMPLTAADRSTLPKPPMSEPGIDVPTPAAAAMANTPATMPAMAAAPATMPANMSMTSMRPATMPTTQRFLSPAVPPATTVPSVPADVIPTTLPSSPPATSTSSLPLQPQSSLPVATLTVHTATGPDMNGAAMNATAFNSRMNIPSRNAPAEDASRVVPLNGPFADVPPPTNHSSQGYSR